jgi:hypothetical protein
MQLHQPANASQLKTHMLVIDLEPASSSKRGEFLFKSGGIHRWEEYLDNATRETLAGRADQAAKDRRYSLTIYVQSGASVYLAPITVQRCNTFEYLARFGPPDNDWEMFLERAVNKNLQPEDRTRIERMQQLT